MVDCWENAVYSSDAHRAGLIQLSSVLHAARQKQMVHDTQINAIEYTFSVLLNSDVGTI
jgi:hypothetical protein